MSQHSVPDDPNLPDPLVPGKLPGTVLLEELSRGATRLGGTKPAQPALMTVPRSSPAAFPVAKGCGDWESRRSQECHLPHSPVPLASRPTLAKMSQGLVAIDAGTAALQHCSLHAQLSSASRAGTARWGDRYSHAAGSHSVPLAGAAGFLDYLFNPSKGDCGPNGPVRL